MLTIPGRLDRRPPLKLGKSVLTLTESTKKYPLTAENLRPQGRLRGGRQFSDRRPRGVNYATYGKRQRTLNAFFAVAEGPQACFSRSETFFAKKARFSERKSRFFAEKSRFYRKNRVFFASGASNRKIRMR